MAASVTQLQALKTETTGDAYNELCITEGVPVPDVVLDDNWINHGVVGYDLAGGSGTKAELWSWESQSPRGVCLALPRWRTTGTPANGDKADLFGIICLGLDTSKACFWDNSKYQSSADEFRRGEPVPINDPNIIGGNDLGGNGQGVCTDCHAGRNPFVVHRDDPAFESLLEIYQVNVNPPNRYEPIVPATTTFGLSWPENKDSLQGLGPVSTLNGITQLRCDGCHIEGGEGGPRRCPTKIQMWCPRRTSSGRCMPA